MSQDVSTISLFIQYPTPLNIVSYGHNIISESQHAINITQLYPCYLTRP